MSADDDYYDLEREVVVWRAATLVWIVILVLVFAFC